jgi:hypothetical protein
MQPIITTILFDNGKLDSKATEISLSSINWCSETNKIYIFDAEHYFNVNKILIARHAQFYVFAHLGQVFLPPFINTTIEKILSDQDYIGVAYGDYMEAYPNFNLRRYLLPFERSSLTENPHVPTTFTVSGNIHKKDILFDESLTCGAAAWDFWIKMSEHMMPIHIPDALYISYPIPYHKIAPDEFNKVIQKAQLRLNG